MHADGRLSTFQYETAVYACQSMLQNGAFLLGDATGTGKSRVIAAIARELGVRVVWVSVNSRLRAAAQQEVDAIGGPKFDAFTCLPTSGKMNPGPLLRQH